jgi:cysteine-rich secretory family protein
VKQIIKILFLLIGSRSYCQQMLMFKDIPIPHPKIINEKVEEWNKSQPDFKALSDNERQFYYWVNYSRDNPAIFFDSAVEPITEIYPQLKGQNLKSLEFDLKNSKPLTLLALYRSLNQMATLHANDITDHNSPPSHNSTNGETFVDRFKKFNLRNCGGENISFGAGDSDPLFALVILYLDINVPELGHRKALLNSNYIYTGISFANYKNGNSFIVEDFACSQN